MLELCKSLLPFITMLNLFLNMLRAPFLTEEYRRRGLKDSCATIAKQLNLNNVTIKPIDNSVHPHWSTTPDDCMAHSNETTIRVDINKLAPESYQDSLRKLLGKPFTLNEEGRFILGHELMHLKKQHHKKRLIAFFCIPLILNELLPYYNKFCDYIVHRFTTITRLPDANRISKMVQKINETQQKILNSYVGHAALSFLAYLAYIRSLEKEADIQAAKTLNCARGGIQYFRRKKPTLFDEHLWWLSAYPTLSERINYLKKLGK